ncbi:MAG: thioredoxin domain-containing protein [Patescibacteria group bacterium]|jgi:protein-disulfide isomerase
MNTYPPIKKLTLPSRPRHWKKWLLLTILAIFLAFAFAVVFQTVDLVLQVKRGEISLESLTNQPVATKNTVNLATTDDPWLGDPNAPITIVEFGDFTCPFSRESSSVLKQLIQLYPQKIKLIFRDLPIISEQSLPAASAAACAKEQGNVFFWAMADRLFAGQESLTAESYANLAKATGLKMDQFSSCFNSNKYYDEIKDDLAVGQGAGAVSTPTFFVNGQMVTGFQALANWQKAIDYYLQNNP